MSGQGLGIRSDWRLETRRLGDSRVVISSEARNLSLQTGNGACVKDE